MSFNEANPATSSLLISGDMRANFLATRRHMHSVNLLQDPLFEIWPSNDTTAPSTWRLTGAGATISRQTAAANVAVGDMSAQVTFGGATATLSQFILDTLGYNPYFDGRVVTAGCFVKTSTASIARVRISDGAATTDSAFHTGGGAFEFLAVEHLVDLAATNLELQLRVEGAGNAIFSGAVFLFSDIKPDRFVMPATARGTLIHARRGDAFVGRVDDFFPQRAFIVEHVQLSAFTAPTGASLIADVLQWDGAAFTSMFSSRPTIAIAGFTGGAAPDTTYNRRCFNGYFGSGAIAAGQRLRSEIDQVGSTIVGNDINIYMRYKTWLRAQEIFADFAMVN